MTAPHERTWLERCPCSHLMLHHDADEYRGDGTETCCVEGCDQAGCPGRSPHGRGWRDA